MTAIPARTLLEPIWIMEACTYCTSNAMEKSNHKHQYEHFWNDEDTYGGVDANRWTRFRQVAYEV